MVHDLPGMLAGRWGWRFTSKLTYLPSTRAKERTISLLELVFPLFHLYPQRVWFTFALVLSCQGPLCSEAAPPSGDRQTYFDLQEESAVQHPDFSVRAEHHLGFEESGQSKTNLPENGQRPPSLQSWDE